MPEPCLFCRIVRGEIPALKLADTPTCLAFRDISAQAPKHVLVIPKAHVATLNQVTDFGVLADLLALAKQVAEQEGLAEKGYRVVINTNPEGGQTVYHLHLHLLGGRQMGWPPG